MFECLFPTLVHVNVAEVVHRTGLRISGPASASSSCLQMTSNYATESHVLRVSDARSQVMTRRNVAKMLIAVVVMFGVCFLPVHLLNILRSSTVILPIVVHCIETI